MTRTVACFAALLSVLPPAARPAAAAEPSGETVMVANATAGAETAVSFGSTVVSLLASHLRNRAGFIASTADDLAVGEEEGGCKGWLPCYLNAVCSLGLKKLLAVEVTITEGETLVKLTAQVCGQTETRDASVKASPAAMPIDVIVEAAEKAAAILAGKEPAAADDKQEKPALAPLTPMPEAEAEEERKPVKPFESPVVKVKRGRFWPWIFGGGAIAFTLGGVAMNVLAFDAAAELRGSVHSRMDVSALIDKGESRTTAAFVMYGGAVLCAGSAVLMYFLSEKEVHDVFPDTENYFPDEEPDEKETF